MLLICEVLRSFAIVNFMIGTDGAIFQVKRALIVKKNTMA